METLNHKNAGQQTESVLERMLLRLGVLALATLCLTISIVVLSRWFYHPLIPDDVLLVRELMVMVVVLPLAAVTARHMHIEVSVLTEWTSARTQKKLSTFGKMIGLLFVGMLLWAGVRSLAGVIDSGEYYDGDIYIPIWIGYAVYVLGLAAFFLRLLLSILRPEID